MSQYTEQMNNFDINSLPDLDTVVLAALERLADAELPAIDVNHYQHPLVVGSGNAEATGRIIYSQTGAIYASESSVDEKLKLSSIDGVVIVSASGGKHAPIIADKAHQAGKAVSLITNSANSKTKQLLGRELTEYVFPKNREPYTYNTSTYMGMILGFTQENPSEILQFITETLAKQALPDFSQYNKFVVLVPAEFSGVVAMLDTKFTELFGRNVARDVKTLEFARHAVTVAPHEDNLFISFGEENTIWGKPKNRLNISLPENANYVAMMAIGYWLVGQIQKAQPDYFKDNIADYCQFINDAFDDGIAPIVEGN